MNARTLSRLAGLALACFALPRAEAVTITFNPATTSTFLDITFDYTAGGNRGTATVPGWSVSFDYYTDPGLFNSLRLASDMVIPRYATTWQVQAFYMIDWAHWGEEGIFPWWHVDNPLSRPISTLADGLSLQRVTWDVSSFVSASAVPDAGTTAGMLAGAVALMAVALLIHRRRETPRPRALRGV